MGARPLLTSAPARLVVLDDDAGILRLQTRALEAAGYTVTAKLETGDALAHLRREPCDLLVIDYRLDSGISGIDFYRQLRDEGCDPPAILVTAFSDEHRVIEALRAGIRDVVPKSGEYLDYLPIAVGRVLDQIRAEQQLIHAEALRESEEQLRALNEQLEEANRRKDEFLATLAHELRNPLAPVRFALALLQDVPEKHAHARDVIGRQVTHLVRLIDDLLDLSRITQGKILLQRSRVTLAQVITGAIESATPLAHASGHELKVVEPMPVVGLDADADRLTQVFSNLLNNAIKFTPCGGEIEIGATVTGGEVSIRVVDSGIGIDPAQLGRIFDVFYQGDGTHTAAGGLGIGLTLVKRIVGMHGGRVSARSGGRGCGSEFLVTLPVAAPDAEIAPGETAPANAQSRAARPLRVLIVDDNVDATELLEMVVSNLGHKTTVAHTGTTALRVFETFAPDVALLDVGLPDLNGYDVARRARAMGSQAFLAAVTGWGQEDDRRLARDAGFDCHIVKPADPAVIEQLLNAIAARIACDACPRCLFIR